VGSLGFGPRIANAPGWYPKPSAEELTQDTQKMCIQLEQSSNARRRPQEEGKYQSEIINTLLRAKNEGKAESTLKGFASHLKILNRNADLRNPETVKTHIANNIKDPQTKNSYAIAYNYYCKTNGIERKKPSSNGNEKSQ